MGSDQRVQMCITLWFWAQKWWRKCFMKWFLFTHDCPYEFSGKCVSCFSVIHQTKLRHSEKSIYVPLIQQQFKAWSFSFAFCFICFNIRWLWTRFTPAESAAVDFCFGGESCRASALTSQWSVSLTSVHDFWVYAAQMKMLSESMSDCYWFRHSWICFKCVCAVYWSLWYLENLHFMFEKLSLLWVADRNISCLWPRSLWSKVSVSNPTTS